jgi:hypothetical protein
VQSVIDQYLGTVKPMHLDLVEPSKRYADIRRPAGRTQRGGHRPAHEPDPEPDGAMSTAAPRGEAAVPRPHWRGAAAVFVLLAVVHTWPLATSPGALSRHDNADAQLNVHPLRYGNEAADTIARLARHPDFELLAVAAKSGIRLYRLR